MNPHIEKLARKAGVAPISALTWAGMPSQIEAFARAIAEDCAQTVQFMPVGGVQTVDDLAQELCNINAAQAIRARYGITK